MGGKVHSSGSARGRRERIRTGRELVRRFFGLLDPFRWQVAGILFSLTVATVLALEDVGAAPGATITDSAPRRFASVRPDF